jgi:hypothetical protein
MAPTSPTAVQTSLFKPIRVFDSIGEFKVCAASFRLSQGAVAVVKSTSSPALERTSFTAAALNSSATRFFNANNFLLNATTNPPFGREDNGKAKRAPFHYHDFGWTIGGPVYFFRFGEGNPTEGLGRQGRSHFLFLFAGVSS